MSGWSDWRDAVTAGVFLLGTIFGLIGSCNHAEARRARERAALFTEEAKENARKDATPLVETCITHPSARRVEVK